MDDQAESWKGGKGPCLSKKDKGKGMRGEKDKTSYLKDEGEGIKAINTVFVRRGRVLQRIRHNTRTSKHNRPPNYKISGILPIWPNADKEFLKDEG